MTLMWRQYKGWFISHRHVIEAQTRCPPLCILHFQTHFVTVAQNFTQTYWGWSNWRYGRIGSGYGPLTRYIKLPVVHASGIPGTFSPPPQVIDLDMDHARASRTCRDACRDRQLAVSFEVGGGENVPGIPGAYATNNFTYLVRGPWCKSKSELYPKQMCTKICVAEMC